MMLNPLKSGSVARLEKKTVYKGFSVGQRVAVRRVMFADYGEITPDMFGTIQAFAPKVRIVAKDFIHDGLPYFAFVVFDKVESGHNNHYAAGINICNLRAIE